MKIPLRANLTFLWLCCQKPDTDCFSCFVEEWEGRRREEYQTGGEKEGVADLVFNFIFWKNLSSGVKKLMPHCKMASGEQNKQMNSPVKSYTQTALLLST